jgi:predicted transcriptional regulator
MNDNANQAIDQSLDIASRIVIAYVGNSHNHLNTDALNTLITATYSTVQGLAGTAAPVAATAEVEEEMRPAVSVRKSIADPEFIICLVDGQKVKVLKRYIRTRFGLTPEQYREKFNLPADYPMVARAYSDRRRELAKTIGLGTKGRVRQSAVEALADMTGESADTIKAEMDGKKPGRKPRAKKAEMADA